MTSMLPGVQEIKVLGSFLTEGSNAFGVSAWITSPSDVKIPDVGFKYDIAYDESSKEKISVIFDSHPNPKLLQSLGWMVDQDTSFLVTIPRYLPRSIVDTREVNEVQVEILPQRYSRIVLDHDYYDFGREFVVTEVTGVTFNPVFYYARIVPHIAELAPNHTNADNNTKHLSIDEINPEYDTVGSQFRFIRDLNPRSSDREGVW